MSPWTIIKFEESNKGALKMKKTLLGVGFKLSDKEEKMWENWRND